MTPQDCANPPGTTIGGNRVATLARLPGIAQVSLIFSVPFWIVFAAAVGGWALDLFEEGRQFGPVPVLAAAVGLFAVWRALPWEPQASTPRKLLAPLFVLASLALGYVTFYVWGLAFYPIAVANVIFLFGFRRGVAYSIAALPLVWTSAYISYPEVGIVGATFMTGLIVPMAAFMIGISKLVIDLEQSQQVSRDLLGELVASNAELERQVGRVRELAIAEERARLAREARLWIRLSAADHY